MTIGCNCEDATRKVTWIKGRKVVNYFYAILAGALGVVSVFTGEIVTYVLLGFILLALNNIHQVLKEISKKLDKK